MSFLHHLKGLTEVLDAEAVVFLDDSGEVIEAASPGLERVDAQLLAAYMGIYLRQCGRVFGEIELGEVELLQIECRTLFLAGLPLPENFALVLIQKTPLVSAVSRRRLREFAVELVEDAFGIPAPTSSAADDSTPESSAPGS